MLELGMANKNQEEVGLCTGALKRNVLYSLREKEAPLKYVEENFLSFFIV